jgi:hypothetical protein
VLTDRISPQRRQLAVPIDDFWVGHGLSHGYSISVRTRRRAPDDLIARISRSSTLTHSIEGGARSQPPTMAMSVTCENDRRPTIRHLHGLCADFPAVGGASD